LNHLTSEWIAINEHKRFVLIQKFQWIESNNKRIIIEIMKHLTWL